MKYVKVFSDLYKALEPFSYAEKGRLFDAILKYAESGEQPELTGNERYIWPTIKADIDRQREAYIHQCEVNKVNITNRYEPLRIVASGSEPKQEKTKEKTKDKEKNKELSSPADDRFEQFWQAYPRKVGKGNARQAWKKIKMTDDLFNSILNAIEQQKQWEQWQRDGGRYIPHPATWLNQQRWEDGGIVVPKDRHRDAWLKQVEKLIN